MARARSKPASATAHRKSWWQQTIQRLAPLDSGVVRLAQRRIYVLPTKRGWGFLLTVALMLLLSLNYSLSLGFMVTFLWVGVVLAALIQTFRTLWGLEIAPLTAGHAFAGGVLSFTLMLKSGRVGRERITLAFDNEQAETVSLAANETRTVMLTRISHRRGYLAMGRVTLASEAPIGLWRAWSYIHFPLRGVVFPAPEVNPPTLPQSLARGSGNEGVLRAGNEDLAGLREYQRGDPIQRVAWKAVARGAGWFSKAFEGSGGQRYVHLEYALLPGGLGVDARLSRLTAWVLTCQREGRSFALTLPTGKLGLGQGSEHENEALTALALFPDSGGGFRE